MPALYKRYIPPQPTDAASAATKPPPTQGSAPQAEKKRKRERSADHVAERKAKKVRKQGIGPAPPPTTPAAAPARERVGPATPSVSEPVEAAVATSAGDFSHVRNTKKRHRLEKEARKARHAARKERDGAGQAPHAAQKEREGPGQAPHAAPQERRVVPAVADAQAENEAVGPDALPCAPRPEPVRPESRAEHAPATAADKRVEAKKRRHRLESVLDGAPRHAPAADGPEAEPEDASDARGTKHRNVLSKFRKSAVREVEAEAEGAQEPVGPVPTVVDRLTLPEPDAGSALGANAAASALPPWLAEPTVICAESPAAFADLGLEAAVVQRMRGLGFHHALPVQQALIPLLLPPGEPGARSLPGSEQCVPDIAVSAPTGSGKTISYLLPIIQALRKTPSRGRLRALVVVPTRDLALQVAAVAQTLAAGSDVTAEHIPGRRTFREEQQRLVRRGRRYDPAECQRRLAIARRRIEGLESSAGDAKEDARIDDTVAEAIAGYIHHVPTYASAVDLLVATPGRLIEHINNTNGFALVNVQWLVVDEADKLLDNQHETLLCDMQKELTRAKERDEQDARERYLRASGQWNERAERRLRKVILSATMTTDISKLSSLQLRRPQLVVVRGTDSAQGRVVAGAELGTSAGAFELPPNLLEYAVPVGDGAEKPLVAVEILQSRILKGDETRHATAKEHTGGGTSESDDADDTSSVSSVSSDSSSDTDGTSSVSSGSSDSSSDTESQTSDDKSDDKSDSASDTDVDDSAPQLPSRAAKQSPPARADESPPAPTILIFTSSNESATRFAHLLKALKPAWSRWVATLIKSSKPRLQSGKHEPAIIVSTDRASRGLDSINGRPITHVIQYDVPRSLTSYVHRVGRTARAGRSGTAWTLFTHREGKWFTQDITHAVGVSRTHPVERIKVFNHNPDLKARYDEVLAGMRDEVQSR